MKSTLSFKVLVTCGVLLSGFWSGSAAGASGSFHQSLPVDEPILLDVSTGSGKVEIRVGDSNRVDITGKITVRRSKFLGLFERNDGDSEDLVQRFEDDPPVMLDDGRLKVGHIKDRAYQRNVSISYEIVVPANTKVKSHTGSGSQLIVGVAGPVEVGTGSGKITLTDIGGAVDASSGSGNVRLTQSSPGDVVVSTGSGSSELHGITGALHVRAGSGRIVVDGQQKGEWNLDTGSGSVRIKLPENAAFELDTETGSGGIVVDHPLTVTGKVSKHHLRGEVRGGGDLLVVETGSGGIHIE